MGWGRVSTSPPVTFTLERRLRGERSVKLRGQAAEKRRKKRRGEAIDQVSRAGSSIR